MRTQRFLWWGFVLLLIPMLAMAQSLPFTSGMRLEIGAKAMGMGGAFTGVADDYSALFYNPAGLGQIRALQANGSFSHLLWKNQSTFLAVENPEEVSFTNLDGIGVAIPFPTERGSLVLSFGYQHVRDFGGALTLAEGIDFIDYDIDIDDDTYTLPFEATIGGSEMQEGRLTQTSFGASVEMAPNVFFGGAVNFWTGSRDYSWQYYEIMGIYDVENLVVEGDQWEISIPDYELNTHYNEKYSGVNVSLGVFMTTRDILQIGAMIQTPVTLTGKRDWDWIRRDIPYDDSDVLIDEDAGFVDNKVQSPWIFRLGGAITAGPLTLSGDLELVDYSQMKYKTDPPEGELTMAEANREIRQNYRSTMNYHIGGQLTIPFVEASLRAGYARYNSPLKNALSGWDRDIISFGIGIPMADQFVLDVGYTISSWDGIPDDVVESEKIDLNRFLVSLIYKM